MDGWIESWRMMEIWLLCWLIIINIISYIYSHDVQIPDPCQNSL
jgi:hypothetical protein